MQVLMVFFFQAEDGIRDGHVTGVQTCALPIYFQAGFRAQNPYEYEKDGKLYRKENAYIFDFSPDRTLRLRSEEHTSELQSRGHLVCRLLLEKKNSKWSYVTF